MGTDWTLMAIWRSLRWLTADAWWSGQPQAKRFSSQDFSRITKAARRRRRFMPLSDRTLELLKARCGDRREGWIFTAFSASGHLTKVYRKFRQARSEAAFPGKLVLYCELHNYGTRVPQGTGNLAVVTRAMGHGSPSTAMNYQHPD
jgi:integrase